MKNVSTPDRIIRFIFSIGLIMISYSQMAGTWQWVLYIISAILIVTAVTGFCPLYKVLGINTNKQEPIRK